MTGSTDHQNSPQFSNLSPNADILHMTESEKKYYNKWRLRILISIIFGYATYYLCRQNFAIIIPIFQKDFGFSKEELGWVFTAGSIAYGIGKSLNGYVSDRFNARYLVSIGLLCSGLINIALGFSSNIFNNILFLGSFCIFNNWFQSMGWPPVAKMLMRWFAPKELGTKWSMATTSQQIGGAITVILSSYLAALDSWQYAFFIPGTIASLTAIALIYLLRESPKELNLPTVEAYKRYPINTATQETERLPTAELLKRVFASKKIWYICFANMFLYIVRMGFTAWGPLFLIESKGTDLVSTGWLVALYDIVGLVGGFSAGWMTDKLFHGQRGQVGGYFMLALALVLLIFQQVPAQYGFINLIIFVAIGFCVYGPQVLAGVATAEFASKQAAGTASGLVGAFGYIGASISGVCVGYISGAENWGGWGAVFTFFAAAAALGSVFFFLIANDRSASAGKVASNDPEVTSDALADM